MKGIWQYQKYLPGISPHHRITMGEGNTPLIKSRNIGPEHGLPNLYFKLEYLNPTGSYKDRFAAAGISGLLENNAKLCLATSSGNAGAALAAYSARAGLPCFIAIVEGAPQGKMIQMQVYGAETYGIKGFGLDPEVTDNVFHTLQQIAEKNNTQVQISAFKYSPIGMAGVQTIAFEIADQISKTGHVFIPAGGGGLTLAVAKGFLALSKNNPNFKSPKVHCVQPTGNDTIATAAREGYSNATPVEKSTTNISGLQVPNIIDGNEVVNAIQKSGGTGYTVEDQEVFKIQQALARREGIFCEPAAAVSVAGVLNAVEKGEINPDDQIVCLITGHGFKDEISAKRITRDKKFITLEISDHIRKFIAQETQKYN